MARARRCWASSDAPGWLGSNLLAVGSFHDALGIYGGGAFRPCTPENMATYGPPKVEFVKKFPKTFNTEYWPKLIQGALDKANLTFDDVDLYLFTQLNLRTIETMMQTLGQPIEKTHWVMDKWGYTGSPCVVMALDDAIAQGRGPKPRPDHLLLRVRRRHHDGGLSLALEIMGHRLRRFHR